MSFSVNDIRPSELDALRRAAQVADLAWLGERRGGFAAADCPACDCRRAAPAYDKHGFHWDRCEDCDTAFMNPRPSGETLGEFYARSELYKVWDKYIFPSSKEVRRERIFRPRVARMLALLDRLRVPTGTLFEIGAAHGIFCDEARLTGRFGRIVAIEPSAVQAETCRALGIETIAAAVEQIEGHDGTADVVAAFEVIEHLANPLGFVTAMARLLKPGGLLLVSTPNVLGFEIATLGAVSDSLYPEHVTIFSPDGMRSMLARAGLGVVEFETPGVLDCDLVRTKALAGAIDLSNQPFLRRQLIEDWEERGAAFQAYIAASRQSSHMWFVAQRER